MTGTGIAAARAREACQPIPAVAGEPALRGAPPGGGGGGAFYHPGEPYFEGFCHFRKDVRQFRIDRILDIKPTWQRYTVPSDFVPTAVAE